MAGVIWQDERPAYYGKRINPVGLDQPLYAAGKLWFHAAGPDSGVYLGWFNARHKRENVVPEHEQRQPAYLAILWEGPSRVGDYFRPGYATVERNGFNVAEGPILRPDGQLHTWSIQYDPDAGDARGRIIVSLDGQQQTQLLQNGHRDSATSFDRFGRFNMQTGGWHVEVYLDDLQIGPP